LSDTQAVAFSVISNKHDGYRWIQHELAKFRYLMLSRQGKGVVIGYLMKISGYSRQHLAALKIDVLPLQAMNLTRSHCSEKSKDKVRPVVSTHTRQDLLDITKREGLNRSQIGQAPLDLFPFDPQLGKVEERGQ